MVTKDELAQVMPNLTKARLEKYLPFLQEAMTEFDIKTYLREAAFLAQLAHESGELRYMEEIADGSAYEGRTDLGNVYPGDGRRFKGRGPIQLTGRHNYKVYGERLGLDLISEPGQAATPEVGFRVAALYWSMNGLNGLADQESFYQITQRINGGQNGRHDRERYYQHALRVLSKDDKEFDKGPKIAVNGGFLGEDDSLSRDGVTLVKLRKLEEKEFCRILKVSSGEAVLQTPDKSNHTVSVVIVNGDGFTPVRELPIPVDFDASQKIVRLGAPISTVAESIINEELNVAGKNGDWKLISPPDAWRNAIPFEEALVPLVEQLAKNYGWTAKVDKSNKKIYVGPNDKTLVPPETPEGDRAKLKYGKEPTSSNDFYYAGGFSKKGKLIKLSGPEILNTKLSKHFKVKEFICNNPSFREYVRIHDDLVDMLEKIREKAGAAINLTNAYRPWPHNSAIGGASNSQHIAGTAADIYCDGITIAKLHSICEEVIGDKGGVGRYSTFVHVDVRGHHARWDG